MGTNHRSSGRRQGGGAGNEEQGKKQILVRGRRFLENGRGERNGMRFGRGVHPFIKPLSLPWPAVQTLDETIEQTHVGPQSVYGELPLPRRLMITTTIEFLVVFPAEFRLMRHRVDVEIKVHTRFTVMIMGRGRRVMLSTAMTVVVSHVHSFAVVDIRWDDVDVGRTAAKERSRRRDAKGAGTSHRQNETEEEHVEVRGRMRGGWEGNV